MAEGTNRREFLSAAAALLAPLRVRSKEVRKRPNVLLIMADEWRQQSTGYAGDPNVQTASIDQFAAESVDFENAISGCSVCCPARASLVTGQYPLTHGVYVNDVPLKPRGLTLGESFARAGYATAYIGKWHLFGSPDGKYGRRDAYVPRECRFGFQYWKAAECTHDYNHSLYYENDDPKRKYWPGYDAEAQTADACEYIRQHAGADSPYLLVLSWGPPHFPLESAPARYQEIFRHRDLTLRQNVPTEKKEEGFVIFAAITRTLPRWMIASRSCSLHYKPLERRPTPLWCLPQTMAT